MVNNIFALKHSVENHNHEKLWGVFARVFIVEDHGAIPAFYGEF